MGVSAKPGEDHLNPNHDVPHHMSSANLSSIRLSVSESISLPKYANDLSGRFTFKRPNYALDCFFPGKPFSGKATGSHR